MTQGIDASSIRALAHVSFLRRIPPAANVCNLFPFIFKSTFQSYWKSLAFQIKAVSRIFNKPLAIISTTSGLKAKLFYWREYSPKFGRSNAAWKRVLLKSPFLAI